MAEPPTPTAPEPTAPPTLAEIAARLQGYDPQALSAEAAGAFLRELVVPLAGVEHIPVPQALHRVLVTDVVSPIPVPGHDNSAMDGYAFNHAECYGINSYLGSQNGCSSPVLSESLPTVVLQPVARALAGQLPLQQGLAPGQCVQITTGAPMPPGCDTVVPSELTEKLPDGRVRLLAPQQLRPGDNRRLAGEDLRAGAVALPAGSRISPAGLGLLASLGVPTVAVRPRLRVAVMSTGDEILAPGEPPRPGAVFDSNRFTLTALLTRLGFDVVDLGLVPDQPQALRAAFERGAAQAHAIITSGGVSVGEADHTKVVMRELGDVAFWRVAMRPGRPMAVGTMPAIEKNSPLRPIDVASSYTNDSNGPGASRCVLFGLPGNPVAVMVTFLAFVRPALLRLAGCHDAACAPPPMLRAQSAVRLRKKPGRTEYQRGVLTPGPDGHWQVATTGDQGSGILRSMVEAHGLIVLPHDSGDVNPGDWVSVMVFEGVG